MCAFSGKCGFARSNSCIESKSSGASLEHQNGYCSQRWRGRNALGRNPADFRTIGSRSRGHRIAARRMVGRYRATTGRFRPATGQTLQRHTNLRHGRLLSQPALARSLPFRFVGFVRNAGSAEAQMSKSLAIQQRGTKMKLFLHQRVADVNAVILDAPAAAFALARDVAETGNRLRLAEVQYQPVRMVRRGVLP